MKRDYKDGVKDDITYFTGVEVEDTPAYGMKTLFVVGAQMSVDVMDKAESMIANTFTQVLIKVSILLTVINWKTGTI